MNIKLLGSIQSRKRLNYNKQECYGITKVNKNKFNILISELAFKNGYLFAETMLHELLHLWFFIIATAFGKEISESEQHAILEPIVPKIVTQVTNSIKKKAWNEKDKK